MALQAGRAQGKFRNYDDLILRTTASELSTKDSLLKVIHKKPYTKNHLLKVIH